MADNEGVAVRFWEDPYLNAAKSAEAGRKIFDTVDWCEIKVPGEHDTVSGPVHKMHPDPRERFGAAWAAYQKDKSSEGEVGTPLSEIPWMGKGEIETFKHSGVRTIENLAGLNDANVTKFPGGLALRQKARDWIKSAKDGAPMVQMSEELAKRDAVIADLKAQIQDIVAANAKRGGKG